MNTSVFPPLLRKFSYTIFVTEREAAAASAVPAPSLDGSAKAGRGSESGRGGRKKYLSCPYMHFYSYFSFLVDYFTYAYI